jgi:hypothetical protein
MAFFELPFIVSVSGKAAVKNNSKNCPFRSPVKAAGLSPQRLSPQRFSRHKIDELWYSSMCLQVNQAYGY